MRAGLLDRRVAVLRRVQTGVTELNEPTYDWVAIWRGWAAKIHKTEDEKYAAGQHYESRVVTWRTRYIPDLVATDVLECEGQQYAIKGIRELGRREGTEIASEWQS